MSKLYWQLFIIILSMLTCMPIKYVQTEFPNGTGKSTSNDASYLSGKPLESIKNDDQKKNMNTDESVISEDVAYLSELTTATNREMDDSKNNWTTDQIIRHYGFPFEEHSVKTEDGYDLVLHRIPQKEDQTNKRNFPVLIPHCVGGSSADWVLAGPDSSLAMQLHKDGYDVWLANNRGNTYSRKHDNFLITDNKFWNFTLHELGTKDLPAIIDFIRTNTRKQQLHYIGYSMGTCIFYIMASMMPEYQKHIRSQISMAPVSRLGNSTSSVTKLAGLNRALNDLVQITANGEFNSNTSWLRSILRVFCNKTKPADQKLCLKYIIFAICGKNKESFNTDILPMIVGHYPGSTSSLVVAHLAQFIKRDKFAQFSYGKDKNKEIYNGSEEPPQYILKYIEVPITLMYGDNDKLVQPKDASRLNDELPQIMNFIRVNDPNFNHVDFLWNRNVKEKINDIVLSTFLVTDDPKWKYDLSKLVLSSAIENRVNIILPPREPAPKEVKKKKKEISCVGNCF